MPLKDGENDNRKQDWQNTNHVLIISGIHKKGTHNLSSVQEGRIEKKECFVRQESSLHVEELLVLMSTKKKTDGVRWVA